MEITFSEDEPFIVKNSMGIMLFITIFSIALFGSAISVNDGLPFAKTILLGLPALACIAGMIFHQPLIIVDKNGIIASGKRITDWKHFAAAGFEEKQVTASYTDHFYLIIEYSRHGIPGYFRSTVALTNTEDKSEEAVLAAIDFFSKNYRDKMNIPAGK